MMRLQNIILLFLVLVSSGCKKYLAEEPKKLTSLQTTDQLEALLDNVSGTTTYPYEASPTAAYSTDDTEIPADAYKKNTTKFSIENLYFYVWNVDQIVGAAADALWNGQYKNIFLANLILANVDAVTGPADVKTKIKADAYFLRAYSYWVLINNYALPYTTANLTTPGVPLKLTTNYNEPLARASMGDVYKQIETDVAEAQKIAVTDVDPKKPWRVSQKAIEGFLSRYYLFQENYDKSLEYANKALGSANAQLVDFKTILPGLPATYTNPTATITYSELNDWTAVKYLFWKEFLYARYTYHSSQWYVPSSSLLALYDAGKDLRYKNLMIQNGGRRFTVIDPAMIRYDFFSDGRSLPAGPTIAEMLLNKAEALARKGDATGALAAVNTLREKRMSVSTPLTATGDNIIPRVLEERRREMPFAMRWYDIRRFSVNNYPGDDIAITRNFFQVNVGAVDVNTPKTYTLPVGSKRYLIPINGVELDGSQGQIKQNEY